MKNLFFLISAIVVISISSCKEKTGENGPEVVTVDNTNKEKRSYEIAETEAEFNDPKIESVFKQYLKIQEALINTDASKTASEAAKLEPIIAGENINEITLKAISAIASSDDIKVQRENFETLNAEMEIMLNGALKSGTLYKQYCPMAFNNKGAHWISSSKDILNPYFGDKMLKCGRVDAEISTK